MAMAWAGPQDATSTGTLAGLAFTAFVLAPYAVGVVLTLRVPHHGAGWAFCGLATALSWSAFVDEYATQALAPDSHLPGGELMATLSDGSFVGWFVFLTLCLHYTTGEASPDWLRRLPTVTLVSAVLFQAGSLLRDAELEDYPGVTSPWTIPSLAGAAAIISAAAVVSLGLCLLASVYELVAGFRRSRGEDRQQLLWLVAGAVPLVPAIVAAFAVSYAGYDWVAGPVIGFCVVTLSLGAGLSVLRYRLYDVERVVADSTAYALSTGAVVAAFGLVVLVITRTVPIGAPPRCRRCWRPWRRPASRGRRTCGPATPSTAASTGAASTPCGRSSAGWRRAGPTSRACCATALGDPDATLLFAAGGAWVTADGRGAETSATAWTSCGTAP